jgi:hypothetical protein
MGVSGRALVSLRAINATPSVRVATSSGSPAAGRIASLDLDVVDLALRMVEGAVAEGSPAADAFSALAADLFRRGRRRRV